MLWRWGPASAPRIPPFLHRASAPASATPSTAHAPVARAPSPPASAPASPGRRSPPDRTPGARPTKPSTLSTIAHLNLHPVAAHPSSVQFPDSVLSVPTIFHLHKGKARRFSGNPHIAHSTNSVESVFDVKPEDWMRWAIKVDLPFLGSQDDDGWGLIGGAPWSFG